MDPRSHPSRPPSTSLPQGSTPLSSTPISSMPMPQYTMQHHYPVSQPQTLPPLQPHHSQTPAPHSYMSQPPYRPDLSRFPASSHDVYASSAAPIMPHTTAVGSLPPSSFLSHPNPQAQQAQQPSQHYPPPHSVLPPASSAQSYPQPIAPAPPRDRRTDYSGLPSGAFSYPDGKTATTPWVNQDPVASANGGSPYAPKDSPRTQVVGSQGRRGILPSVPGRATPVATNTVNGSAKNTTIPAKDADGKFPCPHCNKTYLHAKHLKRHLLRHTGDRPYMCVLCRDTFSRSDILKRHFQKCSLRRGNPTGATHLSHPQAHLKRTQAANATKPIQDEVSTTAPTPTTGVAGTTFGEGAPAAAGVAAASVNGHGLANTGHPATGFPEQQSPQQPQPHHHHHHHQQQQQQPQPPLGFTMSSVNGMNHGPTEDAFPAGQPHPRAWMAAPKQNPYLMQPGPNHSISQQLNVDRHSFEQVNSPIAQDPNKRPVMPGATHTGEIDWTSMFQPGTSDGYMNPVFPQSMASGQDSIHAHVDADRKYYPATTGPQEGAGMNGLYLASTTLNGDGTVQPARQ